MFQTFRLHIFTKNQKELEGIFIICHLSRCFGGNASRSEFWSWALFVAVVSGILFGVAATLAFVRC